MIEVNDFLYGGGNNLESLHGFLTASEKYQSPTEQQREKIKKWLENRSEIAECEVGNLKDAWYD